VGAGLGLLLACSFAAQARGALPAVAAPIGPAIASASASASAVPPASASVSVSTSAPASSAAAARVEPSPSAPADSAAPASSVAPSASAPASSGERPAREPEPVLEAPELEKISLTYKLEGVEVRGNARTTRRVVLRYVKFRAGMTLDVDDPELELTRYRLLGTGFFKTVSLSLKKGSRRGAVVLVIDLTERNTIVVNDVWLGLSATADDQGRARPLSGYGGADIAETNLGGSGITLGGAVAMAESQLALRARFLDPAFRGTPWMVQASLHYEHARDFYGNRSVLFDDPTLGTDGVDGLAVVRYRRFGGALGAGHDLSVSAQLWVDYRLESISAEVPRAASHLRGGEREPIAFHLLPGASALSSVRATLSHDTRDSPFLATRGVSASLSGTLSLAPFGSSYPFQKLEGRIARWFRVPRTKGHVVALSAYGGAISGDAPIFERFYIGDFSDFLPDRILDLNTDTRPAPNLLGTAIREVRYGEFAGKVQAEYRVPIYRGHRSVFGIDVFFAGGVYAVGSLRDIEDPARKYAGAARFPADLTFNTGLRVDTNAGGFAFAFSNVFGFLPRFRGER
jgi:outer membrane protein insertion porin family